MRRKEVLFFVLILIGLLLISNTHLGYSFGDSIFRMAGVPPWTNAEYDSGLVGLLVIITGYIGAVKYYQVRFPKIRSRIVLSCIAFPFLFPIVIEHAMVLLLVDFGKEKDVTLRLYLIRSSSKVKFEPRTITLPAHQKVSVGTAFEGKLLDGTGFTGWSNDIGIEIEVDGLKKRYGKEN